MSEVIRSVDLKDLGEHGSGYVEIRFTNTDGATEVWMASNDIDNDRYGKLLDLLCSEHGDVKLAFIDSGVDSRIGLLNQQGDLLREHVEYHHHVTRSTEPCRFLADRSRNGT